MNLRRRSLIAVVSVSIVGLVATGCGRSDSRDGKSSAPAAPGGSGGSVRSARDLVPSDVKSTGVLRVATAVGYPPMEQYKAGTQKLTGVDPDLAAAIADRLGLKLTMINAAFDGLIPGLRSKRWDAVMSSMSDTAERRAAVDFVDYFTAGGTVVVPKANKAKISSLADLCGQDVVLAKGSSNLAIGQRQNTKCGKKMNIIQSEDAPTGLVLLDSGRAAATIIDYPVAQRFAKLSPDKYTVLPKQYDAAPWGIAIDKPNGALRDAARAALQELIDNGGYGKILAKWAVTGSAVTQADVNAGP